jgi:subtilisin family serine protease
VAFAPVDCILRPVADMERRPRAASRSQRGAIGAWLAALALGCTVQGPENRPGAGSARFVRAAEPVPGQYVVVFHRAPALWADEAPAGLIAGHGGILRQEFSAALSAAVVQLGEADAQLLAEDPRVAFVQEDRRLRLAARQAAPPWGLDRIDQPALPLDAGYGYVLDGAGVTVYIVDTGIRTSHADLGGRAVEGFSAVQDGLGAQDCNGHGTHVAGIVGGLTHGVAKGAALVAVRAMDCTASGSTSGVLAAIEWIARTAQRPAVVNMSLDGQPDPALDVAVQGVIAAGIPVAAAAGNGGGDACGTSPGRVAEAITVGATDRSDRRADFSNFGTCVDLFAPGVQIVSASHLSDSATAELSGTSMAAPHVAGVMARYLAQRPAATPAQLAGALLAAARSDVVTEVGGGPDRLLGAQVGMDLPEGTSWRAAEHRLEVRGGDRIDHGPVPVIPGTGVVVRAQGAAVASLCVAFDGGAAPVQVANCACAVVGDAASCLVDVPPGAQRVHARVEADGAGAIHFTAGLPGPATLALPAPSVASALPRAPAVEGTPRLRQGRRGQGDVLGGCSVAGARPDGAARSGGAAAWCTLALLGLLRRRRRAPGSGDRCRHRRRGCIAAG